MISVRTTMAPPTQSANLRLSRPPRAAAQTPRSVGRCQPDSERQQRDDRQSRERDCERRMPVEPQEEQCGRDERRDREDQILEQPEREDPLYRVAPIGTGFPKRPVVDGEPAGRTSRGEDAESRDHRFRRRGQIELVAALGPCDVAESKRVAAVGDELGCGADDQPTPGALVRRHPQKSRPPQVARENRCDRNGRAGGDDDDDERLVLECGVRLTDPGTDRSQPAIQADDSRTRPRI